MSFVGQNPKFKTTSLEDIGLNSTPNPPAGYHKLVNRGGAVKVRDSSGLESSLGGGSGELNLIENPSDSGSWSETGSVFATPATTTTAGDLPLGGIVDTAIKFVATGNGTEATDYNSYSFTTPASLSGKVKVEFYMRPGSGFAESQWTVSVYQSSTRQSLSTDSSSVTYLVNRTGKFTTTVDLLASTAYTLRFARVAGAGSATLNIANVIVGPGIQPQGAVVGEWQSFSSQPTVAGLGTGSGTVTSRYQRIGSTMRLMVSFLKDGSSGTGTSDITVALPSGFTLNNSALHNTNINAVGSGSYRNSSNQFIPLSVYTDGSLFYFRIGGTANLRGQDLIATTGNFTFEVEVPISEWAGSGTVNLAQNDVTYCSNSSTSTTGSDTSSYAYGSAGTTIKAFSSAGNDVSKQVRLTSPSRSSSKLALEISPGNDKWFDAQDVLPYMELGSAKYGITWSNVINSTDVDILFGGDGAAPGVSWSTYTSWSWRLTFSASGQAVGFGIVQPGVSSGLVSASGLPGNTTGNAIASGYVGEKVVYTAPAAGTVTAGTYTPLSITDMNLSIPSRGVWLVLASGGVYINTTSGSDVSGSVELYNSTTSTQVGECLDCSGINITGQYQNSSFAIHAVLITTGAETVRIRAKVPGGVSVFGVRTSTRITAIRIA